jgi:sugar lactone lactonase YvrE
MSVNMFISYSDGAMASWWRSALSLFFALTAFTLGAQVIYPFAGSGDYAYCCDGQPATSAQLNQPHSVAIDAAGNMYISDNANNRIRKVNVSGIISTLAGTGVSGFSGDGASAANAQINDPGGITIDGSGNIYFADRGNHRIRKIDPAGIITTFAGNGSAATSGDGGPALAAAFNRPNSIFYSAGNFYVPEVSGNCIRKITNAGIVSTIAGVGTAGFSGDGAAAINAQLNSPAAVCVDNAQNILFSDFGNNRIRKIDNGGIISTIAGTGGSGFSGDNGPAVNALLNSPNGLAVDATGNIIFCDEANNRVRCILTNGNIQTVSGTGASSFSGDGGNAATASLDMPKDIAIDVNGNIYISDSQNNRIRKINLSNIINTVAGGIGVGDAGLNGPMSTVQFYFPSSLISIPGNNFLVSDGSYYIKKINTSSVSVTAFAGNGNFYPYTNNTQALNTAVCASGIAQDQNGYTYFTDYCFSRVRKISPSGIITTIAGTGTPGVSGDGGPALSANLSSYPEQIAVDATGNVYFSDEYRIRKISPNGTINTIAGTGFSGYSGDGGPAASAQIGRVGAILIDQAGNVIFSDQDNQRIRMINTLGGINTIAGNGVNGLAGDGGAAVSAQLSGPAGLLKDASGNLYYADMAGVIRKIDVNGIITRVAGNGLVGSTGDGGPPLQASMQPAYLALDQQNNLYLTDLNRIRYICTTPVCVQGIEENNATASFRAIYPNPSHDVFYLGNILNGAEVNVYDALGKEIKRIFGNGIESKVDLSDFEAGVYILRIGERSWKLVKY